MAYSLSPLRNSVRVIVTSANSIGRIPDELSMVRLTSARPSAGRLAVPAKMTSSIFDDRTVFGPWAPSTQATASTMLDFPEPFGPTTTMTPGSSSSVVVSAKDLNPLRVSVLRYIGEATVEHPPGGARASSDLEEDGAPVRTDQPDRRRQLEVGRCLEAGQVGRPVGPAHADPVRRVVADDGRT